MDTLKLLCPLLLLLYSCSNSIKSPEVDERIQKIDSLLTALHKEKSFNGNVLIAEKGKVLYQKSFGLSKIASNQPLHKESLFNIASISKTFTALLILQLEEKGLLSINDPIKKYFPNFPYEGITVKNLLTHTSGLYRIQSELIREQIDQQGLSNPEVLEVYQKVQPKAYFPAGMGYKYANTNFILLALIIVRVLTTT